MYKKYLTLGTHMYQCTVGSQSHRCKIWVRAILDGQIYNKTCSVTPICIPKGHSSPNFGNLEGLGAIYCIFAFSQNGA